MVRVSLYCHSPERRIGQGWKIDRRSMRRAMDLIMQCDDGRWFGPRTWEIYISLTDMNAGISADYHGLQWTDQQRKWFERHMKKLKQEEIGNVD